MGVGDIIDRIIFFAGKSKKEISQIPVGIFFILGQESEKQSFMARGEEANRFSEGANGELLPHTMEVAQNQ